MTSIRNKQRPFSILKYLYENTDKNHPVSTPELVRIFQAEDAHANRKTIKDDIDVLCGEGFAIVTIRSAKHSFYLRKREYEPLEINLLIDAVSASGFITEAQRRALAEKLIGMLSKAQAVKVRRHLYTTDRTGLDTRHDYCLVRVMAKAVEYREKILFQYYDYNGNKEKYLSRGGAIHIVSPC